MNVTNISFNDPSYSLTAMLHLFHMTKTAIIHLIVEFGPIVAFFIAGQLYGFFVATAVLMITTSVACVIGWTAERRLPIIPLISAAFMLIGGAITLVFQTPDAIIFADSLYFFSLAGLLGLGIWRGKDTLKLLFNQTFAMTDTGWRILSLRWFLFLVIAGCLNEYVRVTASPDFWVEFKFYKNIIMTVFATYQITLSSRYRIATEANQWGLRTKPPTL